MHMKKELHIGSSILKTWYAPRKYEILQAIKHPASTIHMVNDFHPKTNFLPLAEIPIYLRLCN